MTEISFRMCRGERGEDVDITLAGEAPYRELPCAIINPVFIDLCRSESFPEG